MFKIVVDGFGGDNAPDEVIKGCAMAVKEYDVNIILTGDKTVLESRFNALSIPKKNIEIVHSEGVIQIEDNPTDILKEKINCSMGKGFTMLANGEADAFVSAGSTAALTVGTTLIVKRIKGIKRPSLAPIMPSPDGNYILLDGGANADCRPEMLQQFAIMGSCYMNKIMKVKNPKVGLVNIGTEENKGRELEINSFALLSETPVNFIGNVEGRDIPLGKCDVVVTDGFTGNVILKVVEGMGKFMSMSLKDLFMKNAGSKIAALLTKQGIASLKKRMDYAEVGGSPFLGAQKPVIKAHGSSNALAFKNAVRQAKECVEYDVVGAITEQMNNISKK